MTHRLLFVVVLTALLAAACTTDGTDTAAPSPTPGEAEATPFVPILEPGADLEWEPGPGMPTPRTEVAVAQIGTRAVVAGGFTGDGGVSDAVEAYHPVSDRWEELAPLPEPLHHLAMVASGGRLHVIGGYRADGSASDRVWSIPPGSDEWEELDPMPQARGAMAAAFVDGMIHVVGGATSFRAGGELTSAHHAYDVLDRRWVELPDLPDPRDHLAAAGVDGKLYVVGGRELSLDSNTARLDMFDPAAEAWQRGPDMPTARGGLAAAAWRGMVFVVGGERTDATFDEVEYLDPRTLEWHSAPSLPTPRHGLGAAGFETEELVVLGGGPTPGLSVSGANELLNVVGEP